MQNNLQEILELLQEQFPKISSKSLIKIIFSIKARDRDFDYIWLSRYEWDKFWVSQLQLRNIIEFLRDFWILEKVWMRKRKDKLFLCNYYKIADEYVDIFRELEYFIKKAFDYIDPLNFVKTFFRAKLKWGYYTFKYNGNKYQLATRGRFKNVIYSIADNKIVSPYTLTW